MTDTEILPRRLCHPRFPIGRLVITKNAFDRLNFQEIARGISRHITGDWGHIPPDDIQANEAALVDGNRLLSAYGSGEQRFWIITEADRSVTTILLPNDY